MKPVVYIETSIPSFYHETRKDPVSAAMRLWTREWWEKRRFDFEVVTREAVIKELDTTPELLMGGGYENSPDN